MLFSGNTEYHNTMSVLQAAILGIIQGLTEFLPVSSSGHMLLLGRIMDVRVSLSFELIMHLATLAAVVIVLRKDIWSVVKKPLGKEARLILTATVPTVIIVLLFRSTLEKAFDGGALKYCFLITAIMLVASGLISSPRKTEMRYTDALIIGAVQGLAALPGISRSGSTITAGVMTGNSREKSAKFSFILSIPIILGSAAVSLIEGGWAETPFVPLAVGFICAFISGLFALKFMLKFLKRSFDYFAVYLIALSLFMMLNDFALHLF